MDYSNGAESFQRGKGHKVRGKVNAALVLGSKRKKALSRERAFYLINIVNSGCGGRI